MRAISSSILLVLCFVIVVLLSACDEKSPPNDGDAEWTSEGERLLEGETAERDEKELWDHDIPDMAEVDGNIGSRCYDDDLDCGLLLACQNDHCAKDERQKSCLFTSDCDSGFTCMYCWLCPGANEEGEFPKKCIEKTMPLVDGDPVESDQCVNDLDCRPYQGCQYDCTPPECYCSVRAGNNLCESDADCTKYSGVCKLTHDGTAMKCVQPGTI